MSELEKLKEKRIQLEEESRSLKERQQNLEERTRILEENIAIAELQNTNKATRDAITQLENKIEELEQKLRQTTQQWDNPPQTEAMPNVFGADRTPGPSAQQESYAEPEEQEEEIVTVTEVAEPLTVEEESRGENLKRQREKKKRFF
ncbi:MAG: hypothetical protein QHH24_06775 [Candidatus Bathyarchaeota archaeon]|nr:hypothetical protein [Candidatus Bathyarchaeota archaeon]